MKTCDKKQPAFTDTDLMSFGKHKGEPLSDVPASYLSWIFKTLKEEGYSINSKITEKTPQFIIDKIKMFNYIHNSKEALQTEFDGF